MPHLKGGPRRRLREPHEPYGDARAAQCRDVARIGIPVGDQLVDLTNRADSSKMAALPIRLSCVEHRDAVGGLVGFVEVLT